MVTPTPSLAHPSPPRYSPMPPPPCPLPPTAHPCCLSANLHMPPSATRSGHVRALDNGQSTSDWAVRPCVDLGLWRLRFRRPGSRKGPSCAPQMLGEVDPWPDAAEPCWTSPLGLHSPPSGHTPCHRRRVESAPGDSTQPLPGQGALRSSRAGPRRLWRAAQQAQQPLECREGGPAPWRPFWKPVASKAHSQADSSHRCHGAMRAQGASFSHGPWTPPPRPCTFSMSPWEGQEFHPEWPAPALPLPLTPPF